MRSSTLAAAFFILAASEMAAAPELRLELTRNSLSGEHCRYRQYLDGLPTDDYVTRPCSGASSLETTSTRGNLRIVNGRVAHRAIVGERTLEPYAVDVDAETGSVLRRIPLFFRGKDAAVFDPNPVAALNDTALRDGNDSASAVPAAAYRLVELDRIEASGPLRGPSATMVDRQLPAVTPPDASGTLVFDRSDDGFEDVNAFFHVDRNQQHLQALGYVGSRQVVPYSIEIDAHAANGVDNSYFLPDANNIARGTLYFGEGGTDDAEDADLVVHEYGHAILEWISPGTFGGTFASESRALAEGFGDYWAYSAHHAQRIASGRDPFCLADWDARCWEDDSSQRCGYAPGSDCLRRLDGTRTMADYENGSAAGVEHRNGSIWSSALREIHQALVAREGEERGRAIADTVVIESLFGAPPHPTFAVMAARMVEADRLLYGGAHAELICSSMTARGIAASCDLRPRGEWTLLPSSEIGLPIPENDPEGVVSRLTVGDSRIVERLFVQIDIDHPTRGDLRIDLIAPDGTAVMLQQVSFERGPGIRTTFGLTAAPAEPLSLFEGKSARGVWQLVVRDQRLRDVGTLRSWGLLIEFEGDTAATARPDAAHTQMVPVVAHLHGANDTTFRSDVRIANVNAASERVTLVFTPSGASGEIDFFVTNIELAAGQTVALDDVVDSSFHTAGSGSLEVLGDVLVETRTHTPGGGGTVGQQVPPLLESTARAEAPLLIAPFHASRPSRLNVGVTEIGGHAGVIRIAAGSEEIRLPLQPFGHSQIRMSALESVAIVVESGDARVVAYGSQIDEASDDPMFLPAGRATSEAQIAPVIRANGAGERFWSSDVWMLSEVAQQVMLSLADPAGSTTAAISLAAEKVSSQEDAALALFGRDRAFGALLATPEQPALLQSRVVTDGMSQFIPFGNPRGAREQHLLFVESDERYRTNVGIVTLEPAVAEVTIHDAAGLVIENFLLATGGGAAQTAAGVRVSSGRATVRFLSGSGRAYASLVDQRSGDATWIEGR